MGKLCCGAASLAFVFALLFVGSVQGQGHLAGTVAGPNGPEAGVWVIAETTDLPTKLAKIVVTDAEGRYVVPELPKATYDVWVRGYGLVDGEKVQGAPGSTLNLRAGREASAKEAAEIYPSMYWFSMLKVPAVVVHHRLPLALHIHFQA